MMKGEVTELKQRGYYLYLAMVDDTNGLPENIKEQLNKDGIKLPNFNRSYDSWYSESLVVLKQLLPDRVEDFIKQYKQEKRKEIDYLTYSISDYLLELRTTRGFSKEIVVDKSAALVKMEMQTAIWGAVSKRFESKLFDIQEVLQADIFDCELSVARELSKKGFIRTAGTIAGVVLEKHLGHVCETHNLKSRKKAHQSLIFISY